MSERAYYELLPLTNTDDAGCACCPWSMLTGAAILGGLIAMAEAIRARTTCTCLRHRQNTIEMFNVFGALTPGLRTMFETEHRVWCPMWRSEA